MASLPSVVVGANTLKLESDFKKSAPSSLPFPKRNYITSDLDAKAFDPVTLDFREALSAINDGVVSDSSIYLSLLQKCIHKKSISETQLIHAHMIKTGTHKDLFLMTFVVNVYGKCGSMTTARKVFDKMPQRNVVTWTSLMSGYVQNAQPELAVRVFLEMLEVGAYPTNYTLGVVLNACNSLSDILLGKQIHGYVVKYKIEGDASVGNALCSLYSKYHDLESAIKVFWRVEERNVISWTTVISACGDNNDSVMGLSLFAEMLSEGVEPNEYTFTNVLSLCCVMQAMDVGLQVHSLCIKLGFGSNLAVTDAVIYLYLKCGWIREARKLFDGMERISLVAWNSMIAGHAQMMGPADNSIAAHHYSTAAHRSGIEALNLFLKLKRSDMKPDQFTFSSLLTVCSSLVALEQGEQVHAQTMKTGFLADVVVGTALVKMYNKCGTIDKATKAFVEMPTRTLISWTSMITAFAQHGCAQQALQLFEDMRLTGVKPNKVTFIAVLSACSRAGMVEEALAYFEMMKNDYKIKPVMNHYSCLIDMFVRLSRLDDAFDFVKKMDFEPSEFIWSVLVAGCRSHGKLDLGFYAAEKLLSLNPKDSETYVLLLNMYVSTGRWKDVSRVRKMMRDKKLGKLKDRSWITIRGKVHLFKPADKSCPPCGDVDMLLSDLLEKARALGYEWQGSLQVTEEEEEETTFSTVYHSEKLAIAFGLLNTANAMPIRVVKSIGMCRDCHNFIKFVSVLTAREIIIRDSKRLHKFVNGKCSCGEFGSLLSFESN